MKRLPLILFSGLLLVAGIVSVTPVALAAGKKPQLSVKTLSGTSFDLAAQRGKWVIVNYWATWCRPCLHEMPALSGYVKKHANVTAIGLAFEDAKPSKLKAFLAKHPVSYPVALVNPIKPPSGFAAPLALPTTYVIAPDGAVAKHFTGPITAADLDKVIGAGH